MPWREQTVMEKKQQFILRAKTWKGPFSKLCRLFGISRTTGYKWCKRYAQLGMPGLEDKSRRPHHSPNATLPQMCQWIIEMRDEHPVWGGRKIHVALGNDGLEPPSASTISRILRRAGRIEENSSSPPLWRFEKDFPNELWQVDFKGYIDILAGSCHPLTVTDDHSRFNILLRAFPAERALLVQEALVEAFRACGMPVALQFDNGSPWGNIVNGQRRLTSLAVWLMRLGVEVRYTAPYHPQSNGKAERFHRTLKNEVLQGKTFSDLAHCQREFDRWRKIYNLQRPHEALGNKVPASRYEPSPRRYPDTLPAVEYPSGAIVRKVDDKGCVSFRGQTYRIGKALWGEEVELRETPEGKYTVYFCQHNVGNLPRK